MHPAEHRDRLQPAQHQPGARVAPRASALVHRDGVGVLHAARADPVPARNSHPLLGQVLRCERGGRLVRVHRPDSGAGGVYRLCRALLPVPDVAQVRGDCVRDQRVGDPKGADGE